jgi:biopolymer transport protein ExbD
MHLGSPVKRKKARIEIIPLIDVMFFLLAAFMMVSLTLQKLKTLKMDLPSSVAAKSDKKPDIVTVDITKAGDLKVEGKPVTLIELEELVKKRFEANTNLPVYLKPEQGTPYGRTVAILDTVKSLGISKVSFNIDPPKDGVAK